MKYYYTSITAMCPDTNKLTEYQGPIIQGLSFTDAEKNCKIRYPYACIVGEIIVAGTLNNEGEVASIIDYDELDKN